MNDGDSSETSLLNSNAGHVDDVSRDIPPIPLPDNVSVHGEGEQSSTVNRDNDNEAQSPNVCVQYSNIKEGPPKRRPLSRTTDKAKVTFFGIPFVKEQSNICMYQWQR